MQRAAWARKKTGLHLHLFESRKFGVRAASVWNYWWCRRYRLRRKSGNSQATGGRRASRRHFFLLMKQENNTKKVSQHRLMFFFCARAVTGAQNMEFSILKCQGQISWTWTWWQTRNIFSLSVAFLYFSLKNLRIWIAHLIQIGRNQKDHGHKQKKIVYVAYSTQPWLTAANKLFLAIFRCKRCELRLSKCVSSQVESIALPDSIVWTNNSNFQSTEVLNSLKGF